MHLCALNVSWAKGYALTVRAFWRAEELRWVEMNFFQCSDEMKTVEKNLLRWHMRRDGMRWEEVRWGDMRCEEIRWFEMRWAVECEVLVWSAKCMVWRVQCEVWGKCSLDVACQRGRTPVTFSGSNSTTSSHKAQSTHARRTAHAVKKVLSPNLRQLPPRRGGYYWYLLSVHHLNHDQYIFNLQHVFYVLLTFSVY